MTFFFRVHEVGGWGFAGFETMDGFWGILWPDICCSALRHASGLGLGMWKQGSYELVKSLLSSVCVSQPMVVIKLTDVLV